MTAAATAAATAWRWAARGAARADGWVRRRALGLAGVLLVVQTLGLGFFIAGTHGAFVRLEGPPTTTDFASFYTAGRMANEGRAALAYDPAAHLAAERAVVAPGVDEKRYLNPPVFLLLCAPLARLPYLVALVVFELASFLPWLWLTVRIAAGGNAGGDAGDDAGSPGRWQAALCLAGTPAVFWALGWGQNSFLSAGLMAGGTLLLRARPAVAGALFGALIFKPHFGVLLPVALLAGGRWRVVLAAAAAAGALAAASAWCFGSASWWAFLDAAGHARQTVESPTQLAGHIDAGGALRLLGVPASAAWGVQTVVCLGAATTVGLLWWRARAHRLPATEASACAALVAGTLVAMPFLLFYDLVMASVAAAWLVRAARLGVAGEGLALGLAASWLLGFAAFPAAVGAHVAVGALVGPILMWQACRVGRARAEAAAGGSDPQL